MEEVFISQGYKGFFLVVEFKIKLVREVGRGEV